ncbi:MAG: bifunctional UDP-N-acetylglucosamine diphosphorylase/glucosamine-1-phosphate N-acetyltransferase GlmU [Firmicutes bacterium]|nr:bifunctional UDP-N-acetylglucosamine diphosphorylase/glucosamine-1-phosphate N-acetyltransferase GlmU [Bacillota bacterium]
MKELSVVVLAAGEGKRMRSGCPKVLHPICGRPMLSYILDSVSTLTDRVTIVVGHEATRVKETMGPGWEYVFQADQLGTGHAVMQALPGLPASGQLLVLCGDTPLLETRHLREMLRQHPPGGATVMTARVPDPYGYGRIIRSSRGQVEAIVEEGEATVEQRAITEVNTGAYCFDLKLLARYLPMLEEKNIQREYYLTDLISLFNNDGHPVQAYRLADYRVGLGVNDRQQLAEAAVMWRERINRGLMIKGVTLIDPETTYIDYGVEIGPETEIWPQTIIEAPCTIGDRCRLGPSTHLKGAVLEEGVTIRNSVVEDSRIGAQAMVGPFAYIRPGCQLGSRVKVGTFVEVKGSNIEEGTKIPHLSYVGDADIGEGVNIGAGVIVVNYDGRRKHRCRIEPGAFVGCNSNLISPLTIGEGAFVAAGSTINRDVPAGSLALARTEQKSFPGRASKLIGRKGSPGKDKSHHPDV